MMKMNTVAFVSSLSMLLMTAVAAAADGINLRGPLFKYHDRRLTSDGTGKCMDDQGFKLTMRDSVIDVNNLGNKGPEFGASEDVLRYNNIGEYDGHKLALQINIKHGWDYVMDANRANENGYVCTAYNSCDTEQGSFARISQRPGHNTVAVFNIIDEDTHEPVNVPVVKFSVYDIDNGGTNVDESFVITGWKTALYDQTNAEAYYYEGENAPGDHCSEAVAAGENCLYSISKFPGNGCDTPMGPDDLGIVNCNGRVVNQKLRMFQVDFENVDHWELWLSSGTSDKNGSRGTLFALNPTAWEADCKERLIPQARSTDFDSDGECVDDL